MRGDSALRIAVRVLSVLLGSLFVLAVVPADYRWPVAGIGALALLVTAGLVTGLAGRPRLLAAKVSRLRPDATVIAAITTIETRGDARVSGAVDRRWDELGGSPVVLAALPDRVEVWARGEDRPRWWVMRVAQFPPQAVRGSIGVRRPPSLRLFDGRAQVTVAPAYSAVRATFSGSQADLARAMTALGVPVTGF